MPLDGDNWSIPSDPYDLVLSKSPTDNLGWSAPSEPGTSLTLYYDVLTSRFPDDWTIFEAVCVESNDTDTIATETSDPSAGEVFHYLVRAENSCGSNMGVDSEGSSRGGRACP